MLNTVQGCYEEKKQCIQELGTEWTIVAFLLSSKISLLLSPLLHLVLGLWQYPPWGLPACRLAPSHPSSNAAKEMSLKI